MPVYLSNNIRISQALTSSCGASGNYTTCRIKHGTTCSTFVSSLFVQSPTFMSLKLSLQLVQATGFREMVASQPLTSDFFSFSRSYLSPISSSTGFHWLFHEIPWLWKFHAFHHSVQKMDWIAGSSMHFFEIVLLRAFTTVPMYFMGYSGPAF